VDDDEEPQTSLPKLVSDVVNPALAGAERSFSLALSRINIEDMAKHAEAAK
jgi:hypothetical protein